MSAAVNGAAGYGFDVAELVPYARHVHPIELAPGDLLFDTAGALHAITGAQSYRDGSIVTAEQDNAHRVWFSNDDPIIAILRRDERPTLTVHDRVFAPQDDPSWEGGDPAVINTDSDVIIWEPDDGNPASWAADQLGRLGTIEPSASPPFTERTWYSNTWTNFDRDGATVETSAHLSGFTRAEVEAIGARITAPRRDFRRHAALSRQSGRAVSRGQSVDVRRPDLRAVDGPGR